MTTTLLISALVLGLASNLHCVGMCGPLVLTLPLQQSGNKPLSAVLYLLAKAVGYALLGALAGLISHSFLLISLQRSFFMALGVMLIIFGLAPWLKNSLPVPFFLKNGLASNMTAMLQKPNLSRFIIGGFLNAFIPCGIIFAALSASAAAGTVSGSAFYMFLFGLAAAPGLFFLMMAATRIGPKTRTYLKKLSAFIIILTGVFIIWRSFIPVNSTHEKRDVFMEWCFPQ